jgi:hypothetical protein
MVRSLAGAKMAIKQPPGKRLVRAVQWTAAVALLALAMFLRVYPLPLESLDGDEIFTLRVVAAPPAEAWNMIRQDLVHPPLYYFLLKATLPADDAPEAVDVRGLSLASAAGVVMCLLGIGAIVPAFRLPSFLAALLLALNKVHIFYSQQARSYSFYCLLVLLLVVWSVHFSKSASRWWYRVSGVALMTVILFTHYVGALFCLACAVSITLGRPGAPAGRSGRFLPLLLFACALVLFSPWLIAEAEVYRAKGGLDENLHWHGIPGFFELKMTFADFLGIPGFRGATTVGRAPAVRIMYLRFPAEAVRGRSSFRSVEMDARHDGAGAARPAVVDDPEAPRVDGVRRTACAPLPGSGASVGRVRIAEFGLSRRHRMEAKGYLGGRRPPVVLDAGRCVARSLAGTRTRSLRRCGGRHTSHGGQIFPCTPRIRTASANQ